MSVEYFDPDGNEITMDEWAVLFEKRATGDDDSWWRKQTKVAGVEVSTVWLGLNHQWGDGPPLTWETMIFHDGDGDETWRYPSRDEAWAGHERVVAALREGIEP